MNDIKNTIYEIMVYINFNLFEHITLDILAERFAYSKFHLHRKFKDVAGVTLNEYIKRRRIENSIYYLFANLETDISEIAGYCGFSSATYSREFKKIIHRTPKQWRNIYKKGIGFGKDSNICKNYERFLCYSDHGIPKEIKEIGIVDVRQIKLAARIFYGNYDKPIIKAVWDEVTSYNKGNQVFVAVLLNSPAVTDLNSCLYLVGFESTSEIAHLSNIVIDDGCYIKVNYHGLRSQLGEAYTWILKYYLTKRGLKYDYRPQFQEYDKTPDFDQSEITCKLYIPIICA